MFTFEKNSNNEVFKKLPDGTYDSVTMSSLDFEYSAWRLVNGEPLLNTDLDSIII